MLNKCIFVGRLSSDVDLRYTSQTGKAVANFNLALTRSVPDQNGERQADFIRCTVWGKTAETMAQELSKGDTIAIESRVQSRSYDDKDGKKVYVTEFVVEGSQFLKVKKWENGNGNRNTGNGQQQINQNQNGQQVQPQNQTQIQGQNPFYGQAQPYDINDEDLPF